MAQIAFAVLVVGMLLMAHVAWVERRAAKRTTTVPQSVARIAQKSAFGREPATRRRIPSVRA